MQPYALDLNNWDFRQGFLYSILLHLFLFFVFIFFTVTGPSPAKIYHVVDLSIGSMEPAPSESAPVLALPQEEEKDFLPLPSAAKKKKALPLPVKTVAPWPEIKPDSGKGPGAAGAARLDAGLGNGLGIKDFPYSYYTETLRKKISGHWNAKFWSDNILKRKAQVVFTIGRDGSITNPEITENSGDAQFDLICLRSVSLAAPFPPLPEGFAQDKVKIVFDFEIAE